MFILLRIEGGLWLEARKEESRTGGGQIERKKDAGGGRTRARA